MKIIIAIVAIMVIGFTSYKEMKPITENKVVTETHEAGATGTEIRTLDQAIAKKNMDENKDIILLDVRTAEEYKELHIPKSILVTLDQISEEIMLKKIPNKKSTIYIYCRSGNRSREAYGILLKMRYENIYNIGGINTWPFETEKS